MLAKYGAFAFLLSVALAAAGPSAVAAQQNSVGPKTVAQADQDYPKAYVCTNVQYATTMDDKPGKCPQDGTPLQEIRIGLGYKCLRGPANLTPNPGRCPTSAGDKVPVTVSVFWTCKNDPSHHLTDPGKCADGSDREIGLEERPHGDHNPRHGAPAIFMSADLFHHIEGTYVAPGIFRVYFYNEFTKPMKVAGYTGRVALTDANAKITGEQIPLKISNIPDGNAMEVQIPNAPVPAKSSIVHIKLLLKFKPGDADFVTDHTFPEYSKDPTPATLATSAPARSTQTTSAPKPATTNAGRSSQPSTAPATVARAAAPKPAAPKPPAPKPAAQPAPQESSLPAGVMAGGAEVSGGPTGPQVVLPEGRPALIAFLKENAANVSSLLNEGQLGGMWYPALNAKDAGLELDAKYTDGLSAAQKGQLASAVKQLTVVAWQIDAAGDLGNGEQLHLLQNQFDSAVKDVLAVYGQ
jgi:hypothetical protein